MTFNGFYGQYPSMDIKAYDREINDVISSFELV